MVNSKLSSVFSSLADSTRTDILQRLTHGPISVGEIAEAYTMSLPAVSKHLRVLEQAEMISRERRGRKLYVQLTPSAINIATDYLEQYKVVLSTRLESFRDYVNGAKTINFADKKNDNANKQQELTTSIALDGTPERIWSMYTDPVHMAHWSPPLGTHLIHCENRVMVGGVWKLIVQNKLGAEFGISGIYDEVSYASKLIFTDGLGEPTQPRPEAHITITFEALPNNKTLLTRKSIATREVHQLNAAWFAAMSQ
jgi:uncharacterized protein YndB with AHSA1/START domain/DNA-binding transcriptional ArsR family regulator